MKDEIKVVQYMTELAPATFSFIGEMLKSEEKSDKKWAAEQMAKLYMRAIPQEVIGDPERPIPILNVTNVPRNNSDQEDKGTKETDQSNPGGDIGQQDGINTDSVDSPSAE